MSMLEQEGVSHYFPVFNLFSWNLLGTYAFAAATQLTCRAEKGAGEGEADVLLVETELKYFMVMLDKPVR